MAILEELNDPNGKLAGFMFWCPGCKCYHSFEVGRWSFNGSFEKPTFSPSLLITIPSDPTYRCHLHVRDGKIEYCGDCKHKFAGKTIEMEEID